MKPHSVDNQPSFLVSCVGAYHDSGLGTGGFVCVHDGQVIVIDRMDCTGLAWHEGKAYRFVRSLHSILGYSAAGLQFTLKLPEAKDVHDIQVVDQTLTCVSTGQNAVLWFDALGQLQRRWQAQGEGDAWHLNCLCQVDDRTYVSAFGEFEQHRGWVKNAAEQGFILDLESGQKVVTGLSGPHSIRYVDRTWVVCNSHSSSLLLKPDSEDAAQVLALNGFTRGLTYDDRYFYVGESANRKTETSDSTSAIAIIDRNRLEVVDRIPIPFPEIYDILLIPPEFAAQIAADPTQFTVNFESQRIGTLEQQLQREAEMCNHLQQKLQKRRVRRQQKRLQEAIADLEEKRKNGAKSKNGTKNGTKRKNGAKPKNGAKRRSSKAASRKQQQTNPRTRRNANQSRSSKRNGKQPKMSNPRGNGSSSPARTWEDAVLWLRHQPDQRQAVRQCYFDDPVERAAERYCQSEEWQAVQTLLKAHLPATVLDLGAGRGISSYAFAQAGCQVTALEPDPSQVVGARAIQALIDRTDVPIQVVQDYGERLPFADASFDIVYGRAVLHHADDLRQFCREAARVLKPGGVMLVTREHVISRRKDLQAFLNAHLLHHLYGGEHAYLLADYLEALESAGLTVKQAIAPFESVINYAPMTQKKFQNKTRNALAKRVGGKLAQAIAPLAITQTLYGRYLSQKSDKPGRHYSFLAVKP